MSEVGGPNIDDEPTGFFNIDGNKVSRIETPQATPDTRPVVDNTPAEPVMENPYIAPLADMDYKNAMAMDAGKPSKEPRITSDQLAELQRRSAAEAAAKAPNSEQTLVSQSTQRIETPAQPAAPAPTETSVWARLRQRFGRGKS